MRTLLQAVRHFSDPQVCIDTVAAMRWPEGKPVCPRCGGLSHYYLKTQFRWKCKACTKQFSVKQGTIFEDSPVSLDKWLVAIWMIGNCKNGVSSYEVSRAVGVTQKTAWFMLHRIREAMRDDEHDPLEGVIEMDETFVGGKVKNMHKAKRTKALAAPHSFKGKAIVVGMLERNGRIRAEVVAERTKAVLHQIAHANIAPGSTLITDEHHGYRGNNFQHEVINHAEEYVRGMVHTQGIENFWSLLKRGLTGTYISVEPFHLFRYIDEQAFRFNHRRGKTDGQRFGQVLSQVAGKRLTYAEVTGKVLETAA